MNKKAQEIPDMEIEEKVDLNKIKKKAVNLDRYIEKVKDRIKRHSKDLEKELNLNEKDKALLDKGMDIFSIKEDNTHA